MAAHPAKKHTYLLFGFPVSPALYSALCFSRSLSIFRRVCIANDVEITSSSLSIVIVVGYVGSKSLAMRTGR